MISERLKKIINNSIQKLQEIVNTLDAFSSISLSQKSQDEIKSFDDIAISLKAIITLIDAREYNLSVLQNLCSQIVQNSNPESIYYQGMEVPFKIARLLGFQSYLSITWAICDSVTKLIGNFVCSDNICN